MSYVEQYVMAYRGNHDEIKELVPEGFSSLRPVLRINAEIIKDKEEYIYIEFNTPVEGQGKRGWMNITTWDSRSDNISVVKNGKRTTFYIKNPEKEILCLTHIGVGIEGGCPHESDNDGIFFKNIDGNFIFKPSESISENKEYCDCEFRWNICDNIDAFTKQAMAIDSEEVLGAYVVDFTRG